MNHSEIVSFIWGVADLIRDVFKRGKYQDVILPLTVLRRLDCTIDITSISQVSSKHINPAQFSLLSLPGQRAIADFLDGETARIDALIEKIEKAIKLLKEYRTALISAAVTGKIDVREEVEQKIWDIKLIDGATLSWKLKKLALMSD